MTAPVVVHVNLGSWGHGAPNSGVTPSGQYPEQTSELSRPLDPHAAHREWPSLWTAYLRRVFHGPMMSERIAMAFQVSERTARKWLNGEGGCNGRHVRVAVKIDREAAMQTLFHMAAE